MAEKCVDSWERKWRIEAEEFVEGWSWDLVLYTWRERLADFSVSPQPLFTEVWVCDPKNPTGRETSLSWWPTHKVRKLQMMLQRHLDHFPGTIDPVNPFGLRQGELDTVEYLWRHKDDVNKTAAILIAASLFSRLYSSRMHIPTEWPPYHCVEALSNWAYTEWLGDERHQAWQHYNTEVLPRLNRDDDYRLTGMSALVRYLAEEHASVLSTYRAVEIVFRDKRDPLIDKVLLREYDEERKRQADSDKAYRIRESEERRDEERRKKEHPRYGEWPRISRDELERLVWSKPTKAVAHDFGVSDVAIAKKCKSLGIAKPPRGFWARVETGFLPHPHGKAPRTKKKK